MEEIQKEQPQIQQEDKIEDNPWKTLGYGVLLIAASIYLYYTFSKMEVEGGTIRINRIVALAYELGGKWPVAIALALLGLILSYTGLANILTHIAALSSKKCIFS
jgi:hypothetical protein